MVPLHFLFFRLQMGCLLVLACGSVLGSLTTPMDLAEAWPFLVRRWRVGFAACAHCTSGGVFSHHVFGCTWRATGLGKAFVGHLYALVRLGFQLGRSSCMGPRWQTCKAFSIFGTAARAEAQGWAQDVGKLHWFACVGLWRHLLA